MFKELNVNGYIWILQYENILFTLADVQYRVWIFSSGGENWSGGTVDYTIYTHCTLSMVCTICFYTQRTKWIIQPSLHLKSNLRYICYICYIHGLMIIHTIPVGWWLSILSQWVDDYPYCPSGLMIIHTIPVGL